MRKHDAGQAQADRPRAVHAQAISDAAALDAAALDAGAQTLDSAAGQMPKMPKMLKMLKMPVGHTDAGAVDDAGPVLEREHEGRQDDDHGQPEQ